LFYRQQLSSSTAAASQTRKQLSSSTAAPVAVSKRAAALYPSRGSSGLGFGGGRGAAGRTVPVAGRDAGEDGTEAEDVEPAVTPIAQHQLRGRLPGPARLAPHIVIVAGSGGGGFRSWPWQRPRVGPATELARGAHLPKHARSEMAGGGWCGGVRVGRRQRRGVA